jgi:hypothetical protein
MFCLQHHPKYSFNYGVHDGKTNDIKKHSETRDGDKTEGEYSFVEADGTTRTVKYFIHGKSGFQAQVKINQNKINNNNKKKKSK